MSKEFFDAIRAGDRAKVGAMLASDPSLLAAKDEKGLGAFIAAKYSQRNDIAALLLEKGVEKGFELDIFAACMAGAHDRVAQLNLYGEHMSYRQHYMDLDPTYTDKFGDPLLRFTLDWTDHEHKQREFAYNLAAKIAPAMGAKIDPTRFSRARYNVINYQSTHIQGGATMGATPESSVVKPNLQQ